MPYWQLYYHLVWATHKREPLLDQTREEQVLSAIQGKANELHVSIHALGCVEDHIHVVASIPPGVAVGQCVGQFKGAASHYVNHIASTDGAFAWQEGYGALSLGESALRTVVEYVQNQKVHHAENTLRPAMERIEVDEAHTT